MLIENIFNSLFNSSNYFRIVFPHLDETYFSEKNEKIIFKKIKEYNTTYNKQPRTSDIKLVIESDNSITEKQTSETFDFLDSLKNIDIVNDEQLLIKQTEEFVQNRALELAIYESVDTLQNPNKERGCIEDIIKKALSIEFEVNLGHDYFINAKDRLDFYLSSENKTPIDIDVINQAIGGGFAKKSIYILMAQTNVGKTTWLCHFASALTRLGKDTLYISAEMGLEEIGKRIDANLLDIDINELGNHLDKNLFKNKIKNLFSLAHGKLIIKEVDAGSYNARHISNLLTEIQLKKGYLPEFLVLDHLTLFSSYRLPSSQVGSHIYVQTVTEEIRAVAKKFNITIITACQFNRGAKEKKDQVSNEDVGLGYGISQTSDWSGAIIQTPELREAGKYILKVIKTRFGANNETCYTVGISFNKMKLTNLEESEQEIPIHLKDKLRYEQQTKNNLEETENGIIF